MTIAERKQKLMEQLRTVREQRQGYTEALEQVKNSEQQLIGAIAIIEQLAQEAAPSTPPENAGD